MVNIYGVFWTELGEGPGRDRAFWGTHRNKRTALRHARQLRGEVRMLRDVPEIGAYDAPTFRVLSDRVRSYFVGR